MLLFTILSTIVSLFKSYNIFSFLIAFIVSYVVRFYYNYLFRPNPLPGPLPLPLIGNAHQASGTDYNEWLKSIHKKYGDMFEVYLAGQRHVYLCRKDLIESMNIPSTKQKYPYRLELTEGIIEYGFGRKGVGVINNIDPKSWQYNRQFFTQAMMIPSLNYQAVEWSIETWKQMESYWYKLGEDRELDLTKWVHRYTTDMMYRISTGLRSNAVSSYYNNLLLEDDENCLSEEEKEKVRESERFTRSIEVFLGGIMMFFSLNKFVRHYVPFVREQAKALLQNRDYLFGKLYSVVKQRRIEIETTPLDQPINHSDMLTSLITANTPRDINVEKHADVNLLRPMTDGEIRGNLLDAMIGGTDTTANTLCCAIYFIEQNPEVKQKLRRELDTVLGNDVNKTVTFKNIEELKYCEAIIKESFRHAPVTFMTGRINDQIDNVGGYDWPKNTHFQMLNSVILMRDDYWTDPEKFDPDRFYELEKNDKYLLERQHSKDAFLIWGGGIRICPGRKLALIELKCLISMMYRNCDIELVDKNAPLKIKSSFLASCEELPIRVKPRKV